ncbi:hypothetical protein [Micromonospora sp. CB01531]|uniref:hypothetical protein n=1 Tax=Micromonospora sp. CB01531 TaxID=1718947 RepID=UPI00130151D1|nr:hypothetical protein [Micromonospora sp. CB01531]
MGNDPGNPIRLRIAKLIRDALVTLLPGDSAAFTVRADVPLDLAALTTRPVLRCVNDM